MLFIGIMISKLINLVCISESMTSLWRSMRSMCQRPHTPRQWTLSSRLVPGLCWYVLNCYWEPWCNYLAFVKFSGQISLKLLLSRVCDLLYFYPSTMSTIRSDQCRSRNTLLISKENLCFYPGSENSNALTPIHSYLCQLNDNR